MQSERTATTTTATSATVQATSGGVMPILRKLVQRLLCTERPTGQSAMPQARLGKRRTLKRSRRGEHGTTKRMRLTCKTSASATELAKPTEHRHGLRNQTGCKYNAGINSLQCTTEKGLSDGMLTTSFLFKAGRCLGSMCQTICVSSRQTKTNERRTNMLSHKQIITALTARVEALEGAQA